jgi:protein-S-isoprenylcysteine O-methyltransferase Ste14
MVKRVAGFAYGVASHLLFLGTLLYAVGFIGGFGVPTRLDGERRGPLGAALAIDAGLYILAAIQFEERDLVREYGHAYEDYRRRVPMLVPSGGRATKRGVASRAVHASDVSVSPPLGEEL